MQNKETYLYFDFDNVLVNSTKRIVELFNKDHNTSHDWSKVRNWNFTDVCTGITIDEIDSYFGSKEFFEGLEYTDIGMMYFRLIEKFHNHPNIKFGIISKGNAENLKWKKRFINAYIPTNDLKLESDHSMDKSSIKGEYMLIDDNATCAKTCGCKYSILYCPLGEAEWNSDVFNLSSDESNVDIVEDAEQFKNFIVYALKKDGII